MRVGYVRVSSVDQNTVRQLDGVQVERVFTDRASGKDTTRPQLAELQAFVRDGDTVLVHSMDRLARNLDDLRRIVRTLTGKGVRVEFVKENLIFTGEDSPMANLMLSVMGAFAEFERSLILERQREGIAAAKTRGVYTGRKPALSDDQADQLRRRAAAGQSKAALAREYKISRETVYAYLRPALDVGHDAPPTLTATVVTDAHDPSEDPSEDRSEDQGDDVTTTQPRRSPDRPVTTTQDVPQDVAAVRPAPARRTVDLAAEIGEGWHLVQQDDPSGGSWWQLHHHATFIAAISRAATSRGRRGWRAVLDSGIEVPAPGSLATGAGSPLWRTRDLAAAGVAHHLAQHQPPRRRQPRP